MNTSNDTLSEAAGADRATTDLEQTETDAELIAEFTELVRDVSEEIARQAVVPLFEQTMAEVAKSHKSAVRQIEDKVRTILEEDRDELQKTLQNPIREVVDAYQGAQETLATLASSSRLMQNLEILKQRLEDVRQITAALEKERQHGKQVLKEGQHSLEETLRRIDRRIPDAARVLDEVGATRESLHSLMDDIGQLASDVRETTTQLHESIGNRVLDTVEGLKEAVYELASSAEETGERLATRIDESFGAHFPHWKKTLHTLEEQMQQVELSVQELRQQVSTNGRLLRWFFVLWVVLVLIQVVF